MFVLLCGLFELGTICAGFLLSFLSLISKYCHSNYHQGTVGIQFTGLILPHACA